MKEPHHKYRQFGTMTSLLTSPDQLIRLFPGFKTGKSHSIFSFSSVSPWYASCMTLFSTIPFSMPSSSMKVSLTMSVKSPLP